MMKKGYVLMLFVISYFSAKSQITIQGRVLNDETGKGLPSVSVYLNSTTFGAVTDENGAFQIRQVTPGEFKLIASSVGFETYVVIIYTKKLPANIEIRLKLKSDELQGFSVLPPDPNGLKKWGELFKVLFVGDNTYANECKIQNMDVLKFRKNADNTLTVFSREPLQIINFDLGYQMEYKLESFEYDFNSQLVEYTGYIFFKDLAIDHPKKAQSYLEARYEVYKGSFLHFKRSFYANKLEEQGFEMRSLGLVPNPEKERAKEMFIKYGNGPIVMKLEEKAGFEIGTNGAPTNLRTTTVEVDSTDYFRKMLSQPDLIISHQKITSDSIGFAADSTVAGIYFKDSLEVSYKYKEIPTRYKLSNKEHKVETYPISQFVFVNKRPVYILRNGYHYRPLDLKITGFWAWSETISTLLPFDYSPINQSK